MTMFVQIIRDKGAVIGNTHSQHISLPLKPGSPPSLLHYQLVLFQHTINQGFGVVVNRSIEKTLKKGPMR